MRIELRCLLLEEVVDIGAQVVGQIKSFGTDPNDKTKNVDYCTAVEEGTVVTLRAGEADVLGTVVVRPRRQPLRQPDLEQLGLARSAGGERGTDGKSGTAAVGVEARDRQA